VQESNRERHETPAQFLFRDGTGTATRSGAPEWFRRGPMSTDMPSLRLAYEAENPRFQGLRHFPISRYPNYVFFYRPLL
jgi:hypothetical protein